MFLFRHGIHLDYKGTEVLTTERFLLRQFKIYDSSDVFNNWTSDSESAKYNAWKIHSSENVTKEYLYDWIKSYEKANYYHWAIMDKGTEEVIGSISATNIKKRKACCDIGYTIARKYWNQGIATEVLKEIIDYLTNVVGFKTIRAYHDVRNKASGRVMEKAGMTYVKNKKQFFLSSEKFIVECCIYEYKA